MGAGMWTRIDFERYSKAMGRTVTANGSLDSRYTDQELFRERKLNPLLDPKNVMRECCDSPEHPDSLPVILALDVTGSMGPASAQVAKKLNEVMTSLYGQVKDVEFMVMGIGDLAYDRAPIQISQFESDIRIAEQLDKVWMEHGGGGNAYESYTAAWYMALNHTRLDCHNRGRKGLIITMGDEPMNPYLPADPLCRATGDHVQADVETRELYREAAEKFDIYHIHVAHRQPDMYMTRVTESFGKLLPDGHLQVADVEGISAVIVDIVKKHAEAMRKETKTAKPISWSVEGKKTAPEKRGIFGMFSW